MVISSCCSSEYLVWWHGGLGGISPPEACSLWRCLNKEHSYAAVLLLVNSSEELTQSLELVYCSGYRKWGGREPLEPLETEIFSPQDVLERKACMEEVMVEMKTRKWIPKDLG